MNTTIQTELEQAGIEAEFTTMGDNFFLISLSGAKMYKSFSRAEGLKIKNKYNMKRVQYGYRGLIPYYIFTMESF